MEDKDGGFLTQYELHAEQQLVLRGIGLMPAKLHSFPCKNSTISYVLFSCMFLFSNSFLLFINESLRLYQTLAKVI